MPIPFVSSEACKSIASLDVAQCLSKWHVLSWKVYQALTWSTNSREKSYGETCGYLGNLSIIEVIAIIRVQHFIQPCVQLSSWLSSYFIQLILSFVVKFDLCSVRYLKEAATHFRMHFSFVITHSYSFLPRLQTHAGNNFSVYLHLKTKWRKNKTNNNSKTFNHNFV